MARDLLCNFTVRKYRILVVSLGLAGCVIDTVPLPEARPGHVLDSALFYTTSPAVLVGTEGAVTPDMEVIANNPIRSYWQGGTDADGSGSFNMPLNAGVGDDLFIYVVDDGLQIAATILRMEPPPGSAHRANDDLENFLAADAGVPAGGMVVVVSPPDANGIITVSAPPGTIDVGITVVIANVTNGSATSTDVRSDGSFTGRLPGQSGDILSIFAVETASSNAGSAPIAASVP